MRIANVKRAVAEAKRFIERAQPVLSIPKDDLSGDWVSPSKENGALKRASMDLTRALTEMRRPN